MKKEFDSRSYTLQVIKQHLNFENLIYTPKIAYAGQPYIAHGVQAVLPDGKHHLIIQFHPMVVYRYICTVTNNGDNDVTHIIEEKNLLAFINTCVEKYQ